MFFFFFCWEKKEKKKKGRFGRRMLNAKVSVIERDLCVRMFVFRINKSEIIIYTQGRERTKERNNEIIILFFFFSLENRVNQTR